MIFSYIFNYQFKGTIYEILNKQFIYFIYILKIFNTYTKITKRNPTKILIIFIIRNQNFQCLA